VELEAEEEAERAEANKKLKEADDKVGEVAHFMERMDCMVRNFKKKIFGPDEVKK
jgi:hypothetical protein